jgi:hypothetical protein
VTRHIWQCHQCGVLYLEDHEGNLQAFAPLNEPPPTGLLRSYLQDRWKRPTGAHWRADRNAPEQLWWNGPDDDAGWEEFTDWLGLERRYFEVFARLRDTDTLRSAFLRKDGKTVHSWPEEDDATR